MRQSLLVESHENFFLEQGWLLLLDFYEGWVLFRIQHEEWANLQPFSLGAIAPGATLAVDNTIQDAAQRFYLQPAHQELIYHSFWGVTPTPLRVKVQYPPGEPLGSMVDVNRTPTDDVGYIDGDQSPFYGPYSKKTELFTVYQRYPAINCFNPVADAIANGMMNIDQRQYTYEIVRDIALIKACLVGSQKVKKYTMGRAYPKPMNIPDWLKNLVNKDPKAPDLLQYSLDVMGGKR